jgi:hypothetical protein
MPPSRDAVVVPATLDNVRNSLAIDLQVGGKVPAEVRHSDHNETATGLAAALASETADKKIRIRRNLLI